MSTVLADDSDTAAALIEDGRQKVVEDHDLLACILQHLATRDLAAASATAPRLRKVVHNAIIPPRVEAANAKAKKYGTQGIKEKPAEMSMPEYAFKVEEAADVAEKHHKDKIKRMKSEFGRFMDHLRVEAEMRRRGADFEPRIEELEQRMRGCTADEDVQSTYDEGRELENEIRFGMLMNGGMPGGGPIDPLAALLGLMGGMGGNPMAQMMAANGVTPPPVHIAFPGSPGAQVAGSSQAADNAPPPTSPSPRVVVSRSTRSGSGGEARTTVQYQRPST